MSLNVSVLVPDRIFWKKEISEIIMPTLSGQMGVLTNHVPVLTGLDTGILSVRLKNDSKWESIVVMGGFALVKNNVITVLVNEAELSSDIDAENAETSFLQAKSNLEISSDKKKKLEAINQFKKAKARFQIISQSK